MRWDGTGAQDRTGWAAQSPGDLHQNGHQSAAQCAHTCIRVQRCMPVWCLSLSNVPSPKPSTGTQPLCPCPPPHHHTVRPPLSNKHTHLPLSMNAPLPKYALPGAQRLDLLWSAAAQSTALGVLPGPPANSNSTSNSIHTQRVCLREAQTNQLPIPLNHRRSDSPEQSPPASLAARCAATAAAAADAAAAAAAAEDPVPAAAAATPPPSPPTAAPCVM